MYGNSNVDMPTLNPWVLTTVPPASFVFVRNPYYHRIDQRDSSSPIDDVIMTVVATSGPFGARASAGRPAAAQYQHARLHLLKSAKTSGVSVRLWVRLRSQIAHPNLTASDENGAADARVRFTRAVAGDRP
jgi:peptide/nickel transport system substrate-binding protein